MSGTATRAREVSEIKRMPCARGSKSAAAVYPQHKTDLAMAIGEFERKLPGWWWSIGNCSVSRDASCGPDRSGPDADLLTRREFDAGFHCDSRDRDCAYALRNVIRRAVRARNRVRREGAP